MEPHYTKFDPSGWTVHAAHALMGRARYALIDNEQGIATAAYPTEEQARSVWGNVYDTPYSRMELMARYVRHVQYVTQGKLVPTSAMAYQLNRIFSYYDHEIERHAYLIEVGRYGFTDYTTACLKLLAEVYPIAAANYPRLLNAIDGKGLKVKTSAEIDIAEQQKVKALLKACAGLNAPCTLTPDMVEIALRAMRD